jgi:lactoylglutathione lyase
VAVGGIDKMALRRFWVDILGIHKTGEYRSEVFNKIERKAYSFLKIHCVKKENVDEDILSIGKGIHGVEIDIMQPIDPTKSPKVHIPALNHIGLWVDSIGNAVSELTEKGIVFTPGGIRKGASNYAYY